MYTFEKLQVWQDARIMTQHIYSATSKYPTDERFGLVSQLRRASVSVCSNIAEGSTRKTPRDQARFYELSYGSLIEVLNQLIISNDLGFLASKDLEILRLQTDILSKKVTKLLQYNENRINSSKN